MNGSDSFNNILVLGNSSSYEKFMEKKRNDKFMRILKTLKPIYSAKRWEKEYAHQVRERHYGGDS